MLLATVLSLGAAVVHAGWNLAVKRATGDRYVAIWGQFLVAGTIAAVCLVMFGGLSWAAWPYAIASGIVHIAYVVLLARAYDHGDFSFAYPIARGGGAVVAAIGGALVLHDRLSALAWLGVAVAATGLLSFAPRRAGSSAALVAAVLLAGVIGTYSVIDGRGSRLAAHPTYVFGNTLADAIFVSAHGIVTGRARLLRAAFGLHRSRMIGAGIATLTVSVLVLAAVRYAPVGYVSALRESSVVLAALAGWKVLHEPVAKARLASAVVVVGGLVLLVAGR